MTAATPEGWPFWAPSDLAAVELALDLAGVAPGDRLVDLGCGDGQVLVAAARRGAVVEGVEVDKDLAATARKALAAEGLDGTVVVGDVFAQPLDADVLFTYLSPATLQRLVPLLRERSKRGARLVTVDYAAPGLVPDGVDGRLHLYRLPGRRARKRTRIGWPTAGVITTVSPDVQQLTVLEVVAPGGALRVDAAGRLANAVTVQQGADDADRGAVVAVDLRWEHLEDGDVVFGDLRATGCGTQFVATVVSQEDHAVWELAELGVRRLRRRLEDRGTPPPASVAELVAACDDERYD